MSDLSAIRDELVSRLQTVTTSHGALRASKYFEDSVNPPCAVVAEADPFINYNQVLGSGTRYNFSITVYASRATEKWGQNLIDGLRVGTNSIPAVLHASWVSETAAFYAVVHNASQVRAYTFGQIDYLGCEFDVEVVAD